MSPAMPTGNLVAKAEHFRERTLDVDAALRCKNNAGTATVLARTVLARLEYSPAAAPPGIRLPCYVIRYTRQVRCACAEWLLPSR